MNKKQLYESIMQNVAKEVKKALNENQNNEMEIIFDNYDGVVSDEEAEEHFNEYDENELNDLFYNYLKHHKSTTIYNYIGEFEDEYELTDGDVEEFLEENPELEPELFNMFKENNMEEWKNEVENIYWHDLEDECEKIYGTFVIFGTKERWTGVNSGLSVDEDCTLMDVIYKHGKDCEYFTIANLKNGGIYLKCSHHDGTNEVEIHLLNESGKQIADDLAYCDDDEEKKYLDLLKQEKAWEKISLF